MDRVKVVSFKSSRISRNLSSENRRGSFWIARTSIRRIDSDRIGVLGTASALGRTGSIRRTSFNRLL